MTDPAKTSLPLQIAGFGVLIVACAIHNWPGAYAGTAVHFAGDAWFFFQLRAMGFFGNKAKAEGDNVATFDIEKFVKLRSFLVFVGIALAAVMLYLVDAEGASAHIAKLTVGLGLLAALAGFVADQVKVKLPPWMPFAGIALALAGFYFLSTQAHFYKGVAVVSCFFALAGIAYDKIYP